MDPASRRQIVGFLLGSEQLGLGVSSVREVLRPGRVSMLPQAPDFVAGVIDVRGSLVPLIDFRRRFGMGGGESGRGGRVLVAQLGDDQVGLLVDEVLGVIGVSEADVESPPASFRGLAAEYIDGIARVESGLLIIINLERVLSADERLALESTDWDEARASF